jgi:hypothetical protein
LIPIFSFLIKNPQGLSWIRLLPSGIGSILALVGLYHFYRQYCDCAFSHNQL